MKLEVADMPNDVLWDKPVEMIWNAIPQTIDHRSRFKRPDIALSHRLLIASILNLPTDQRPWGIVTWLSEFYQTSRKTIYSIADSILHPFRHQEDDQLPLLPDQQFDGQSESSMPDHQVERAILKMAFPGSVSIRPMQEILDETLGISRSIGFISQLLTRAGQLAGQFLSDLDYAHLDSIIVLRDETFFNRIPILLMVEPKSGMIVKALVADDRKADTWGTLLLMAQDQNLKIKGLVEDMATSFAASLKLIDSDAQTQKDHWHILRNANKVIRQLENRAYRWIAQLDQIERKVNRKWSDELVKKYLVVDKKLDALLDELNTFTICVEALNEAFEIVDVKSGKICQLKSSQEYLSEIHQLMSELDIFEIKRFYKSLKKAFDDEQLLTHLLWVAPLINSWRQKASLHWGENLANEVELIIARHWKIGQLLINGYKEWQEAYNESQKSIQLLCAQNVRSEELVQLLCQNLDASPRASSLIENINGQLKSFLKSRRSFKNKETLQNYLNLFALWYNCHQFKRGKREGKSPFEWANMNMPEGDWLSWLGFPKAN